MDAAILYLFYIPPYGRYQEAIAVMRPELGLVYPHYYNIAAGAYLGLGQLDNGMRMARESVRLGRIGNDPSLPTGLYLLGLMQRCAGQPVVGFANLREARGLSPENDQIKAALADDVSGLCRPVAPDK